VVLPADSVGLRSQFVSNRTLHEWTTKYTGYWLTLSPRAQSWNFVERREGCSGPLDFPSGGLGGAELLLVNYISDAA
jgi:hypothetical protein